MIAVTVVTSPELRTDNLSAQDYREIYDELRSKTTLRQFATFIGSAVTFAWWSKYERGESELTHERKNELRRIVGLPLLGTPVTQVSSLLEDDVTVYHVGNERADRAVFVGRDVHDLEMRINGSLNVMDPTQTSHVTAVTSPLRNRTYRGVSLRVETVKRLALAKNGRTLDRLINDLLDAQDAAA